MNCPRIHMHFGSKHLWPLTWTANGALRLIPLQSQVNWCSQCAWCALVAERSLSKMRSPQGGRKKKVSKGLLRCLWIFPWQTIVSQCQVVGTGYFVCKKLCLGGMWGFVREGTVGESMITPTLFRFMVKTEGLLSMHVKGPRRAPPPHSRPAKANVYPNNLVLFFTSAGLCLLLGRDHRHSQAFTQVRLSFQTLRFTQSIQNMVEAEGDDWIQKHQSAGLILQQQSWLNELQFHVFFCCWNISNLPLSHWPKPVKPMKTACRILQPCSLKLPIFHHGCCFRYTSRTCMDVHPSETSSRFWSLVGQQMCDLLNIHIQINPPRLKLLIGLLINKSSLDALCVCAAPANTTFQPMSNIFRTLQRHLKQDEPIRKNLDMEPFQM